MNITEKNIDSLIPYDNNPRYNEEAVEKVAESIKAFGFKVPIVIDKDNVIVAGHTRLLATKKLGLKKVPCIVADDLTNEQIKAFRLADNKVAEFATWDFEKLNIELNELKDIDFDLSCFGFDMENNCDMNYQAGDYTIDGNNATGTEDKYNIPANVKGSLVDQYTVPPFSVLDTRQGYWQDRKKQWLELTGNLSETRDEDFGRFGDGFMNKINGGTSNFDPVLAEVVYKWFCTDGGKILDCFGGEQTKGVVAGELGYTYEAVEFRKEQVELNTEKTKQYKNVKYYCGDSNNIEKIITTRGFNLCFTSPPYYDLEVYGKEDMSALGSYEEFMAQYRNIFTQCFNMLDENAFLVVKVADIRNKKTGEYRGFVADNIKMFQDIGFQFYNDIVLINQVGTACLRVNKYMSSRKVVKLHQNVLVFYKGKIEKIKDIYKAIDFGGGCNDEQEVTDIPS